MTMINVCTRITVFPNGWMGERCRPPWLAENLLIPLLQEKSLQNQIFILPPAKVYLPELKNSFHV